MHTTQFEGNRNELTAIYWDFIFKIKFGLIGPKIKLSLNLHENSHTSQSEDDNYKYNMMKGFLNSNPDLGKNSFSNIVRLT